MGRAIICVPHFFVYQLKCLTLSQNILIPFYKSILMKICTKELAVAAMVAAAMSACSDKNSQELLSPDGNIRLEFGLADGKPFYTVARDGSSVIDTSYVGLSLKSGDLGMASKVLGIERSSFDEEWEQPWGEESTARNHYNEMKVCLAEEGGDNLKYDIVFRAFDDGVGFRYEIPGQAGLDSLTIMDENTQFNIANDAKTWSINWDTNFYEGVYREMPVSQLDTVSTPMVLELGDSLYVALHEAALTDYASQNLYPIEGTTTLRSFLTPWSTGEKVFAKAPMKSPWRTIIIGSQPGDLMLSRLMLNLNEPCAIEDVSWIKPGRYIGIWWGMHRRNETWHMGPKHGATTENMKKYIDFAAANGYPAVLAEGWNKSWGGEFGYTAATSSFTEAYPDFDLEEVVRYAKEKGVDVITHHETYGWTKNYENQLDSTFAMCERLGIHAAKTGYAGRPLDGSEYHGSQYGVRHFRKVIEEAAKHKVMIDNHEPVMPTGLQRTYPNLMTQEGVRGQEWNAWDANGGNPVYHTVTLPFTRGLAGPMDYTPGVLDYDNKYMPGTRPQHTIAHELALSVVLYSPLVMSADEIDNYVGHPGFEFLKSTPTNWSKTLVPEGRIGEYITVARRDRGSDNWYVGTITGENARDTELALNFLEPGVEYTAKIFADGEGADYVSNPTALVVEEIDVNSDTVLPLKLAKGGGAAIMIEKK